ncbi:hypothetical protein Hanom_Chr10g00933391 [Helianthus anomalus]
MCIPNRTEWYTEPNRTGLYRNEPTPLRTEFIATSESRTRIAYPNRSEPRVR